MATQLLLTLIKDASEVPRELLPPPLEEGQYMAMVMEDVLASDEEHMSVLMGEQIIVTETLNADMVRAQPVDVPFFPPLLLPLRVVRPCTRAPPTPRPSPMPPAEGRSSGTPLSSRKKFSTTRQSQVVTGEIIKQGWLWMNKKKRLYCTMNAFKVLACFEDAKKLEKRKPLLMVDVVSARIALVHETSFSLVDNHKVEHSLHFDSHEDCLSWLRVLREHAMLEEKEDTSSTIEAFDYL